MTCCNNTLDIGCFDMCENIVQTELVAFSSGVHYIVYEYRGQKHKTDKFFSVGENITLDPGCLNEANLNVFQIIDPAGDIYEITDGADTFNCFSLRLNVRS